MTDCSRDRGSRRELGSPARAGAVELFSILYQGGTAPNRQEMVATLRA